MANKFRPLKPDEIECRISQIKVEKGQPQWLSLLLYKDARCDQNVLDEIIGPMNWKREHTRDNRNCIVSIWDPDKGQWVSKEDTGTESNTEKEKGLASDSFKRACFNWGIGRELYTAPFIKITPDNCDIKVTNGKAACYDHFSVKDIAYENGRIVGLKVYNSKKRRMVFVWGKESSSQEQQIDKPEPEEDLPEGVQLPDTGATVTTTDRVPDIDWNPNAYIKAWAGQNTIAAKQITEIRNQLVKEGKLPGIKFAELTRPQCDEMLAAVKARLSA